MQGRGDQERQHARANFPPGCQHYRFVEELIGHSAFACFGQWCQSALGFGLGRTRSLPANQRVDHQVAAQYPWLQGFQRGPPFVDTRAVPLFERRA